jgi:hypothetical protein
MSFLAPLFLLGGLALALPILFHLIRRTSRVRTVFSSIMFLRAGPPRMTRRNRIEDWLLLFLRCLVLALLALAFARPFFKGSSETLPPVSGGSRMLVLLDTSASMQRTGFWTEAVARLETVTAGLRAGDGLAVWTFDRGVDELFGFEAWDSVRVSERRGWVRARLDGVRPGWKAAWLDQALIEAADALAGPGMDEAGAERRLVVISDLPEGNRLSGVQAHDWPPGVTVQLEPVGVGSPGNAGLHLVADSIEGQGREVRAVRVRVENSADSRQDQFQVGWVLPGTTQWAGTPFEVYVPAGQSRVVAVTVPDDLAGLDRLVLRGDAAPFDNTLYIIPPEPRELRVVYLGAEPMDDPSEPLFFLGRAFRETARHAVRVEAFDPAGVVPASALDDAALVVATGQLSAGLAVRVRTAALAGTTVLLAPVDGAAAASHEPCLAGPRLFAGEAAPSGYAMLGDLDFRHPWLTPFADARYSDFTKIRFWRYRRMDEDQLGDGRVVARFDRGDLAVVEWPVGKGRVLWLASGWHPRDSQLALSSKFVPLLYSLLDMAGVLTDGQATLEVGDELAPASSAGTVAGVGTLIGPGGEAIDGAPVADRPGIYRWIVDGNATRRAVNLAPSESRTRALSMDDFEALGVPLRRTADEPEVVAARLERLQHAELEQRQKLWRWVLGGTLGLVLLETGVAARALRRGRNAGAWRAGDAQAQEARSQ